MDVREKLVELLNEVQETGVNEIPAGFGYTSEYVQNEKVASHLIANGVTVQERGYWASLTDCANAGVYCSVCNKKIYKEDYARCNRTNKLRSAYCPNCGSRMDGDNDAKEN